jgi:plasmid stability protein
MGSIVESAMNVNFTVKHVPAALAERLRLRAERHHRSLQGELLAILEAAARDPLPEHPSTARTAGGQRSFEETVQRLRALFPVPASDGVSSAELIRQMRDGRNEGRHGEAA